MKERFVSFAKQRLDELEFTITEFFKQNPNISNIIIILDYDRESLTELRGSIDIETNEHLVRIVGECE